MDAETAHRRSNGEAAVRPARSRLGWLIQILCLLYAGFVLVEDAVGLVWQWPTAQSMQGGSFGAQFDFTAGEDGFVPAESVTPGGPMALAGVATGDRVRFDRRYDFFRRKQASETVGFTLAHAGRISHRQVVTEPRKDRPFTGRDQLNLIYILSTSLAAVFGAFIVWRSQGNATTILLGMGLLTYGLVNPVPQLWLSAPAVFPFAYIVGQTNLTVIPVLFYAFALRFYGDYVGPVKRLEMAAFWAYAAFAVLTGIVTFFAGFDAVALPVLGNGEVFGTAVVLIGFAVCLGYLVMGWRRSAASVQQRYALMLVAAAAIMLAQLLDLIVSPIATGALETFHFLANSLLTGVIASGLFAYSILRHRVFDLGFAVNRTLVYGVVSAILLAAFGLIEWAVDHFVPIHGREKSALIDAAIAVGVFLTFHRVRDLVEHGIEALFFRSWQRAEARLRRFVREAAFITEGPVLAEAFAKAVGEFAEGAQAAIYLQEGRVYARAGGLVEHTPDQLDPNLPAIVALRADLKPLEVQDAAVGAALVAPMVNRNEVLGLVALGPKPSGLGYRPDEIELIGWATRQVGLDLHALKVERFAAIADELRRENSTLRSLIPHRA